MLVCVICLPYPRLPVRRAPKSEFWSQTHLGSNLPLSGCATLGKSLHLSEPWFPFQREPGTLVHSVGVKNYILSKKLENKNYVKTFFFWLVVPEVLVSHSHPTAPANSEGEWTKSSPRSFTVSAVPFAGRVLPVQSLQCSCWASLTMLVAPQGADALRQNEANICILFANEQSSFVPFSSLGFSCLEY